MKAKSVCVFRLLSESVALVNTRLSADTRGGIITELVLKTETKSRSIKTQKENESRISSHLDRTSIPRLHVALCFYFCVCRFLLQNVFLKLINLSVFFIFILVDAFSFLPPSRQRNHTKSFYGHGKYFAKENFREPAWASAKCYCGNKTCNPERAVSLHLARSRS